MPDALATLAASSADASIGDGAVFDPRWQSFEPYCQSLINRIQHRWEDMLVWLGPFGVWMSAMKAALGDSRTLTFTFYYQ